MAGRTKSLWYKMMVQGFGLCRQATDILKMDMTAISELITEWQIVLVRKITKLSSNIIGIRKQRHKLAINNFR